MAPVHSFLRSIPASLPHVECIIQHVDKIQTLPGKKPIRQPFLGNGRGDCGLWRPPDIGTNSMRNLEEFNGKHKGKTCFVIGAGCSIGFDDLTPLKNHVTIAVNSGYVGYTDSDYYISDDWAVERWSYFFRDLKKSKKTIALLYDKKLRHTGPMFGDRSVLFKHKKGYQLTKPYSDSEKDKHIWEARTSVGSAIHVAHIMGCRPIVLLGVDCCRYNGNRYFWQSADFRVKPYRNDGVPIDNYRKSKIKGVEADTDLHSILNYWRNIAEHASSAKILNASAISLVDAFPKVKFKDVV